jgi:hypothetical protein
MHRNNKTPFLFYQFYFPVQTTVQYGCQAAILNFAYSANNFRMLGPIELKVCMLIDGHDTNVPFENELCLVFSMADRQPS